MRKLSASELLEAWERGLPQSPVQRVLVLLGAVFPEASPDSLARLTIGQRNAELLALRLHLFGSEMASVAVCSQCGGRLDLTIDMRTMLSADASPVQAEQSLHIGKYHLRFRHPNSEDLAATLEWNDADGAEERLLRRCLLSVQGDGTAVDCAELPPDVVDAISEQMAAADPLADIQLAVFCPFCNHRWRSPFDIASFLWSEIDSLAGRLLRDVHTLASAYGWHEKEILALSPGRREFYLASVNA